MNLTILEDRIKDRIPEEYHQDVDEEFSRFMMEISRVSDEPDKIGQATLTDYEVKKAPTTNQHGDYGFTVIQLQTIKGAAIKHGVRNWLELLDPELTVDENIGIMEAHGRKDTQTTRQMAHLR